LLSYISSDQVEEGEERGGAASRHPVGVASQARPPTCTVQRPALFTVLRIRDPVPF
jgi:hypothetical protein